MEKIDFVLIWVDDSDPQWQEAYRHYSELEFGDARTIRFRDWGTLRYWFRGVEKFAPWVNNVFFITCGHVPDWLNLNHPKLRFIKHSDYIPQQYLPTFNSHTIELNLHRIPELGERFVYFNDDTFLINHIPPERFFRKGLPCDIAALNAMQPLGDLVEHVLVNNIAFANRHFSKKNVLKSHMAKWFSPRNGSSLMRTFALLMYPCFTGFVDPHLPNPFLKSTLEQVWNLDFETLNATCLCKFRKPQNISQYVFRYYQLLTGDFEPINPFATSITYSSLSDESLPHAISDVKAQRKSMICLNDGLITDFNLATKSLLQAFNTILPDKSAFEL